MDKYNLGVIQTGISKTVLYDGNITSSGTFALSDSVYNYKLIIVEHVYGGETNNMYRQSNVIIDIYNDNKAYMVCHGNSTGTYHTMFHFSVDGNNVITDDVNYEHITKIVGIN